MNDADNSKCSFLFDETIATPLGTVVTEYVFEIDRNQSNFLLDIRDKLEENQFPTPQSFIDHIEKVFIEKSNQFGSKSDFSLSLLTILQIMTDKFAEMFPPDIKEIKFELAEQFQDFRDFAVEIGKDLPNDRDSFIEFYEEQTKPVGIPRQFDQYLLKGKPERYIMNFRRLNAAIDMLKYDEDIEEIIKIILYHEPLYSNVKNLSDINLKRCSPQTLDLIDEFVDERIIDEYGQKELDDFDFLYNEEEEEEYETEYWYDKNMKYANIKRNTLAGDKRFREMCFMEKVIIKKNNDKKGDGNIKNSNKKSSNNKNSKSRNSNDKISKKSNKKSEKNESNKRKSSVEKRDNDNNNRKSSVEKEKNKSCIRKSSVEKKDNDSNKRKNSVGKKCNRKVKE